LIIARAFQPRPKNNRKFLLTLSALNAYIRRMTFVPCDKCGGTGKLRDWRELGQEARKLREASGLSVREAAKLLMMSAAYLSDIELGRRRRPDDLLDRILHIHQPRITKGKIHAKKNPGTRP
jgi:Helix-turn-helix domain